MKRTFLLLLVCILALSMVACGKTAETPATDPAPAEPAKQEQAALEADVSTSPEKEYEGLTLRYWTCPFISVDDDIAFWNDVLVEFEEETGADVITEIVPWEDCDTKYMTAVMANNCADIMYLGCNNAPDLAKAGAFLDLTTVFTEEDIADELYWDSMTINGVHCMVPFIGANAQRGILANMDILKECGVESIPETWDELIEACQKIQEVRPDVYPFLIGLNGDGNTFNYGLHQLIYQAGGSVMNEDGTAYTLDTEAGVKAMTFLNDMVNKYGILSEDALGLASNNVVDLFTEGKVAMHIYGAHGDFSVYDFEWGFSNAMHDVDYGSYSPIDPIVIWSGTENKEAATALLKYLRSPDVTQKIRDGLCKTGRVLESDPYTVEDERLLDVYSHPERCFGRVFAPGFSEVEDSCVRNMQLCLMGELTPEEAMRQIQADADRAYEENK